MKSLVIAEKPSVGRDIARVLHCSKNIPGALEGDKYIVTWALGHLVTLADPEEYDKKYSKWDMETLPMMPEKMQLVVIRQAAKQYGLVKKQLFRKDVNQIFIAATFGISPCKVKEHLRSLLPFAPLPVICAHKILPMFLSELCDAIHGK